MDHKLMNDYEKADIFMKAHKLKQAGKNKEASALIRTTPLPAYLAKFAKKYLGTEALIQMEWNMAEAEAEFGSDWLNQENI